MAHLQFTSMFSPQLLDHFQNPRGAGDIQGPDARAEVTNPVCGDVLRLTLRIQEDRIAEARFKAQGCVPTVACGSALTEIIQGKTVGEARAVTSAEIVAALGEVPPASMHAVALALEALSVALMISKGKS
jgi:nitrogen fixation protein NifU and related proteins